MALRILRKPRSGCLEGRTALIQPIVDSFTSPEPEKSIAFMRRHGSPIGRDPIVAVYNMAAFPPARGFPRFLLVPRLVAQPDRRCWAFSPPLL